MNRSRAALPEPNRPNARLSLGLRAYGARRRRGRARRALRGLIAPLTLQGSLHRSPTGGASLRRIRGPPTVGGVVQATHLRDKLRGSGLDVNSELGTSSPFPWENEISVPGPLPGSSIEGVWGPDGWISNPGFAP
jgi:hypothetical protein